MKIQCELCKEIVELGAFRSSARGLDVTCVACGGQYFVPAASASAPASPSATPPAPAALAADARAADARAVDAPATPGDACPKCDEPRRPGAGACPRCGLAAERFSDYHADEEAEAPAAVAELWQACRARWSEPTAHARFLEAAAATGAFRYAASRYRASLRAAPGDPIARARLDDVARRAEAALLVAPQLGRPANDQAPKPFRKLAALLVVLGLLVASGLVYRAVTSVPMLDTGTRARVDARGLAGTEAR